MEDSYQSNLFGSKATEPETPQEGNVVIGFSARNFLMLDVDDQTERFTKKVIKNYAKFHDLGSVIILRTSKSNNTDLFGNRLDNFAVIFGKPLKWKGILWHISETKRLGIINRGFAKMRFLDAITIRVNSKNAKTPPPEVIKYYSNGEKTGILRFIKHKNLCIDLGESWRRGVK